MDQAVDRSFRLLGARFLRKQAKRLAMQIAPTCLAKDTEGVHQSRVASRRLRAALELFADCFPAESVDRWQKALRRVTRGFGPARDQDVHILFLAEHLAHVTDSAHTRGIATLLGRLERDRARSQAKVIKVADRFRQSGVLAEILDTSQAICARAKTKETTVRSPLTVERAERCLAERFAELNSEAGGLRDPAAIEQHHAMRIVAKRLRYTMEMLAPVFGHQWDASIRAAKQLQTLLGDIHDYDVWDERIDLFEQKMRQRAVKHFGTEAPLATLEVGLEQLRTHCRRRRSEIFDELCAFWNEQPFSEIEPPCSATSRDLEDSLGKCKHGRTVCRETR
ncbi:MAG: CHAD domain-containing protein [Pirellulales bacterium]|nr:CHAD domain-containing protein [Pirellulales bacterium]